MTDRKTVSTINDLELTDLYDENDELRRQHERRGRVIQQRNNQLNELEEQLADARAEIAACRKQQWPKQLGRAEEALRETLDCIILGNGQPRDPDDLTRWRAVLNPQEQPRV